MTTKGTPSPSYSAVYSYIKPLYRVSELPHELNNSWTNWSVRDLSSLGRGHQVQTCQLLGPRTLWRPASRTPRSGFLPCPASSCLGLPDKLLPVSHQAPLPSSSTSLFCHHGNNSVPGPTPVSLSLIKESFYVYVCCRVGPRWAVLYCLVTWRK